MSENKSAGEHGFTLLELLISMTILAVIVGIALGGIKLALASREAGDRKVDSYQRLRFIGEQITKQVKSFYPLFIKVDPTGLLTLPVPGQAPTAPGAARPTLPTMLAFEGLPDSIRFISLSDMLTQSPDFRQPAMHEVRFYLGTHPKTGETGVIMMERDLQVDEPFSEPNPESPGTRFITLARDASSLKFRYYMLDPLTPEELKDQKDPSIKYRGRWADTVIMQPYDPLHPVPPAAKTAPAPAAPPGAPGSAPAEPAKETSMPRAVEISVELLIPPPEGKNEAPRLIALTPFITPLQTGTEFIRTVIKEAANAPS